MLKNLEKGSGNEVDKQSKFRNQSLFVFIIFFLPNFWVLLSAS